MYDPRNSGFCGLLRLLLVALAGFWLALPAQASFPASATTSPATTVYSWHSITTVSPSRSATAQGLCDILAAGYPVRELGSVTTTTATCYARNVSGGFAYNTQNLQAVVESTTPESTLYSCPSNSTLSGSSCTCNSGLTQSGSSCVDPCAAGAGSPAGDYTAPGGPTDGTYENLCAPFSPGAGSANCSLSVRYIAGYGGNKIGAGTWVGSACTPDPDSDGSSPAAAPPTSTSEPPEPGKPAATTCPVGTFQGTFNGQAVCVEPSPNIPVETVKKTTTDDGTNTVKKESTTTCAAGSCNTITTTTTTNNSTASVNVTNNTKSEPKSDFCEASPNSPQCSVGCQSDVGTVGCATLSAPVDGDLPTSSVGVPTVQSDALAGFSIGHACPADLSFSVLGRSYGVSFQPACDVAPMVKPVVLLGAAFGALFIVYSALVGKTS
jgi:hypothetical protein